MTLAKRHPPTPANLRVVHMPGESSRLKKVKKQKKYPKEFNW